MKGAGVIGVRTFDPISQDVLISIVNYRTLQHCIKCLDSLVTERQTFPGLRVVVADGASGDGSVAGLQEWVNNYGHSEWITILPLHLNGGFGWAHNQVILRALHSENPPDFIHILNPDTIVEKGAVAALRRVFDQDPQIAVAGSQLINAQGGLQPAGFQFPNIRTELARGAHAAIIARLMLAPDPVIPANGALQVVPALSGASFMMRCAAIDGVGMFDHGFFLYSEEIEWMHRLGRSCWKIVQEPGSRVYHEGGAATKLSRDRYVLAKSPRAFYWYQSQRRCLYRTMGPVRARLAALSWFTGHICVALPRSILSTQFGARLVKNEARDMLRAWCAPDAFERRAFVDYPGDAIDQAPAWMTKQINIREEV